jgi:two-component system, chemotaxis family, sensor kinase CheA
MSETSAEFLEIFRDEVRGRLDRVADLAIGIERGKPSGDAMESLLREMHTIKGAASMVGREDIRAVAHAAEDRLVEARDRGSLAPSDAAPLLLVTDALRQQLELGEGHVDVDGVIAQLAASATPEPAPPEPEPVAEVTAAVRGEATAAVRAEARSIRVAPEKIDTLLDLVGETVLHRRRLEHEVTSPTGDANAVVEELQRGDRLFESLTGTAVGMRTQPLASIVGPFPRAVRDLAASAGKEAELVIEGGETELDRVVLEGLSEPLVHLLRNAVAHGIEDRSERVRRGKHECGRIRLAAEQRGGLVEVSVSDDGRGVSPALLARATDGASLAATLAQSGLSTAGVVDEIAGRGVGFGAVVQQVDSFGGSVEVRSVAGEGTEVILRLPLVLALLEVLLAERGGVLYGFPVSSIEEVVVLEDTLSLRGRAAIELRGSSIAQADLGELLGELLPALGRGSPLIVLGAGGRRLAVGVEALAGKEQVIVKSMSGLLSALDSYLGASILGDGRIALLLDPQSIVQRSRADVEARSLVAPPIAAGPATDVARVKVLVVEDSFIVRELQRSILEAAGYRVVTAQNGRAALELLDRDRDVELVVTDIEMPELDGVSLTESIRATPDRASLPVVIVTSRGDDAERRRGIEAGADAYIVKQSFDQRTLIDTVERLLGPG